MVAMFLVWRVEYGLGVELFVIGDLNGGWDFGLYGIINARG